MDLRRLPVLAGPVVAGLLLLGGCAGAPETAPAPTPAPAAATALAPAPAPAGSGQTPCTARLRPGAAAGGGTPLTLTPEVQAQIDRLRRQPPGQATPQDPELAARLAEVGRRVEDAARPCAER